MAAASYETETQAVKKLRSGIEVGTGEYRIKITIFDMQPIVVWFSQQPPVAVYGVERNVDFLQLYNNQEKIPECYKALEDVGFKLPPLELFERTLKGYMQEFYDANKRSFSYRKPDRKKSFFTI